MVVVVELVVVGWRYVYLTLYEMDPDTQGRGAVAVTLLGVGGGVLDGVRDGCRYEGEERGGRNSCTTIASSASGGWNLGW